MHHTRSFPGMMNLIRGTAICSDDHIRYLLLTANIARAIPGEAAELGVYRGGTARLIAEILSDRPVHLFDTFAGIPEDDSVKGGHIKGAHPASLQAVRQFMAPCKNAVFHVGFFPETAKGLEDKTFSYAHFDGDIYQSCKAFIEFFWPRMNKGGIMAFHDYGFENCPGVKKALEEAQMDVIWAYHCQCFVVKT